MGRKLNPGANHRTPKHYCSTDAGDADSESEDGRISLVERLKTAQTTAPESWKIVIDGKELSDSGGYLETPGPSEATERLQTVHLDFGTPIAEYFPKQRLQH
jgi:hypothetical protein